MSLKSPTIISLRINMSIKADCRTKEGAYEKIREELSGKGYNVMKPKEIEWGLQFEVVKKGKSGLIRIYQSDKKGVIFDPSTLKDKEIEKYVLMVFGYSNDEKPTIENNASGNFYS